MTTRLPAGIITNSDSIVGNIERADAITVEDVRRFWKVYNANTHLLRRNSGRRLENLFWRIWGSHARLCQVLSGSTLARLFIEISEDHEFIRTTPVPSPRVHQRTLDLRSGDGNSSNGERRAAPRSQVTFDRQVTPPAATTEASHSDQSRTAIPPPPILKNARKAAVVESNTRRHVGATAGVDMARMSSNETTDVSDPSQSDEAQSTHPGPASARGKNSSRPKRTTFAVSAVSSRRRPVVSRRKSSQSSSSSVPTRSGIPANAVSSVAEDTQPESSMRRSSRTDVAVAAPPSAGPVIERRQRGASGSGMFPTLSVPALHRIDDGSQDQNRRENNDPGEQRRRANLAANSTKTLPTLASTSTAALGTVELGETTSPVLKSKGPAAFKEQVIPLKPAAASSSSVMQGNIAATPTPLTRTKSHLVLLLERDRQSTQAGSGAGKKKRKGSM